jgi:hypothetical protein
MQVNIADQPYWATIQPITGPSRNVPMEPTPIKSIDHYLLRKKFKKDCS